MENSENDKGQGEIAQTEGSHNEFPGVAGAEDLFSQAMDLERLQSERGGVVTARGTIDGVVIRLDGRASQTALFPAIEEFLSARESFLGGSEVSLEWVGAKPEDSLVAELTKFFQEKYRIKIKSSKLKEQGRSAVKEHAPEVEAAPSPFTLQSKREMRPSLVPPVEAKKSRSLFDGMEVMGNSDNTMGRESSSRSSSGSSAAGFDAFWDDADARMIHATLRSGQKIETDHSLIVFGDVNSGAEIVAGGDIIVLGTLRGVAHAGAYDETGGGRVIFALNLQPTQLRIGTVISRSSSDVSQKVPEIARVEDGIIMVETYSVKNLSRKI